MNVKLLIFSIILGTISAIISVIVIFVGLPQKANTNIENYVIGGIFIAALLTSVFVYLKSPNHELAHTLIAFGGVIIGVVVTILIISISLIVFCKFTDCRIIPFL